MFNIELDIFSGRINPQWQLTQNEQTLFLDMIMEEALPIVPVGVVESKLGYRGFIVRASEESANVLRNRGLPSEFRINANLTDMTEITGEEWLLDSMDSQAVDIPDAARDEAQRAIGESSEIDSFAEACSISVTSSTNFNFWNANSYHRTNNNCYNYCSNWRTNTFAQPGRGTGQMFTQLTVSNVRNAAIRDGYVYGCNNLNIKVALVIWPGVDYHWYRRTQSVGGSQRWCHKAGQTPAKNTDNSGNYITSPYSCNRGPYTSWGGYLYGPGSSRQTVS